MKLAKAIAVVSVLWLTGCASIVGSPDQLISIASTPDNATISITDETYTGGRIHLISQRIPLVTSRRP